MDPTQEPWIRVGRDTYSSACTMGIMRVDNKILKLYTIEDRTREDGVKIPGETCIPAGTYRFVTRRQNKNPQRVVIWILDVPGFDAIQIHIGNKPKDSRGCILPGKKRGINAVISSGAAMDLLMANIGAMGRSGQYIEGVKGWIEIKDAQEARLAFLASEKVIA
jgi:hypothetical protein